MFERVFLGWMQTRAGFHLFLFLLVFCFTPHSFTISLAYKWPVVGLLPVFIDIVHKQKCCMSGSNCFGHERFVCVYSLARSQNIYIYISFSWSKHKNKRKIWSKNFVYNLFNYFQEKSREWLAYGWRRQCCWWWTKTRKVASGTSCVHYTFIERVVAIYVWSLLHGLYLLSIKMEFHWVRMDRASFFWHKKLKATLAKITNVFVLVKRICPSLSCSLLWPMPVLFATIGNWIIRIEIGNKNNLGTYPIPKSLCP